MGLDSRLLAASCSLTAGAFLGTYLVRLPITELLSTNWDEVRWLRAKHGLRTPSSISKRLLRQKLGSGQKRPQ
jgi:hypothetical protein